jgi:CheY-like chemotaxis protein
LSKSLRVLLVDDNLESAQALAQLLALAGHHAQLAADASSALELAERFKPDVVLCELGTAGADDMPRELRALPQGERVVIAALSGQPQPGERASTAAHGFDAQLIKPLRSAVLESFLDDYGTAIAEAPRP